MGEATDPDDERAAPDSLTGEGRYRYIENVGDTGEETIIYDSENHKAWIQSSWAVALGDDGADDG